MRYPNYLEELLVVQGYYVLILEVSEGLVIDTRGGRRFSLDPGLYVYVGSARGPGGLLARIKRHLRRNKKLFWHIDYLTTRESVRIMAVYSLVDMVDPRRDYESLLSARLTKLLEPVEGFGASDKPQDKTHLYRCRGGLDECLSILDKVFDEALTSRNP